MKIKVFGEGSLGELYFGESSQGRDFFLLAQKVFFIAKAEGKGSRRGDWYAARDCQ
jgi:hypothetical protein